MKRTRPMHSDQPNNTNSPADRPEDPKPRLAPDGADQHELSVRRLPKQGLRKKLGLALALAILAQAVVTGGVLALLQGPWRQSQRIDHAQTLADLTAEDIGRHAILEHNPVAQGRVAHPAAAA